MLSIKNSSILMISFSGNLLEESERLMKVDTE